MIKIVIVDDEVLARIGMKSLLSEERDMEVTGMFSGAREAMDFLAKAPADVLITDIEMSEMSGIELIRKIREQNLAAAVMIVSCHGDFSYAQAAIKSGTDSYLLKYDLDREKLVSEIRRIVCKAEAKKREEEKNFSFEKEKNAFARSSPSFKNRGRLSAEGRSVSQQVENPPQNPVFRIAILRFLHPRQEMEKKILSEGSQTHSGMMTAAACTGREEVFSESFQTQSRMMTAIMRTGSEKEVLSEDFRTGEQGMQREKNPLAETEEGQKNPGSDAKLLIQLLEEIVKRYRMGTLFSPWNREIFVVFSFEEKEFEEERRKKLQKFLEILHTNLSQYVNEEVFFGVSFEFRDTRDLPKRYEEAFRVSELSFYRNKGEYCAFEQEGQEKSAVFDWKCKNRSFLDPQAEEDFEIDLRRMLEAAKKSRMEIPALKEQLVWQVTEIILKTLAEEHPDEEAALRWKQKNPMVSFIMNSRSEEELVTVLPGMMREFANEMRREKEKSTEVSAALRYIDQHLSEEIALGDLAKLCSMSVQYFSRKFKDQTSMTMVQYLNEQRIRKAKELLRKKELSLAEIAEMTGFSNENYLTRVFKKVTGNTISEYREGKGKQKEM